MFWCTFSIIVCSENVTIQLRSLIHGLKNSLSGWHGLSAYIGKQCVEGFIAPLTHIINMSITQGIFPDELKLARVIPVYKCNDKQTLSNYRPISILTLISKVLETAMYKSISKFFRFSFSDT